MTSTVLNMHHNLFEADATLCFKLLILLVIPFIIIHRIKLARCVPYVDRFVFKKPYDLNQAMVYANLQHMRTLTDSGKSKNESRDNFRALDLA